jgi:uncharacterized protein YdhG (YjbR/CyaY superfamily)
MPETGSSARSRIRAYFASATPQGRKALRAVRAVVRASAPSAEESFSYRIPGFRFRGRPLVWYAAFSSHCSLYPITDNIRKAHRAALRGYHTSKGTVRFPLDKPIPTALVRRLVRARMKEVLAKRS